MTWVLLQSGKKSLMLSSLKMEVIAQIENVPSVRTSVQFPLLLRTGKKCAIYFRGKNLIIALRNT